MKYQLVLAACLLLLWTLTESAESADSAPKTPEIEVKKKGGEKFELICSNVENPRWKTPGGDEQKQVILDYKDGNSGVYTCFNDKDDATLSIYVKFRTCDNCVDLDVASITGLVIGDVVATVVIGVAVYLIASQARSSSITSPQKKSSDRQHLVSNEVTGRASNDHYERLRHKGQRDMYDVINKR